MKTTYKYFLHAAFSTLVCLSLASAANAQHRDGNSGGGSGTRSSAPAPAPAPSNNGGGGGVRPSAPSGGGNSYQRPSQSGGNNGYVRPQGSAAPQQQRVGVAPQGYGQPRQGVAPQRGVAQGNYAPRQGYNPGQRNYAPRTGVAPGQRNSYGSTPRPYVGGSRVNSGYRTYPGTGFERGRESWRTHGYYHYNRGYYSSYYLPRLGFSIGYLPYGYYPFSYGDYNYFYSDGLYYQYNNNEYTVVEPPIGAEVKSLPEKAQSIVINGQQLYELNGVYYQAVTKDDGSVVYEIVGKDGELNTNTVGQDNQQAPQIGDIVYQLPPDCRKIKVNGEKLYVSPDGVYFQEIIDANNSKSYKIVGLPSEENPN